jgi:hypothetical protein
MANFTGTAGLKVALELTRQPGSVKGLTSTSL